MRKRFLAMLVALAMVFTLAIPALPVSAADVTLTNPTPAQLQTALNNADIGDVVTMNITGNFTPNSPLVIPDGVTLVIAGTGTLIARSIRFDIYGILSVHCSTVNSNNNTEINLYGDAIVYAEQGKNEGNGFVVTNRYPPNTYPITYLPGDHGLFPPDIHYPYLNDPTPAFAGDITDCDPGWVFVGWVPDPLDRPFVTGVATYIAQWEKNTATVTFIVDSQVYLTIDDTIDGDPYARPADPPAVDFAPDEFGYKFDGWYTAVDYLVEFDFDDPVHDGLTLYGTFVPDYDVTKVLSYTVEYYQDGVLFETLPAVTDTVWINAPNALTVQSVDTSNNRYLGYKFDSTDPAPIPGTIASGSTIKVYYIEDDDQTKTLSYTVEYYQDGVLFETLPAVTETVWINASNTLSVQSVDTSNNRYIGYKLDSTDPDPIPSTIADGSEIKIYYIPEYDDTNELSYTVEYYKDTDKIATDTTTGNVWVAAPQVLTVQTVDTGKYRPLGYKLDSTDPDPIPGAIADGGVIKVYYVPDYDDTNELSYTVEYYKDVDNIATDTFTEDVWVAADPQVLTVQTVETGKYLPIGYEFARTELDFIPATIADGGVIKVYYIAIIYDIDYDLDSGTNDVGNPDSYTVEDLPIIIADAVKAGYDFLGWTSDDIAIYTPEIEPVIAAGTTVNILFVANWSDAIIYNITYILNDGVNAPGNPSTYTVGDVLITLADPTRVGYNFAGWSPSDNIPAGSTGDREFTAEWTASGDILVTFDANGGADADPISKYVTFDSEYGELASTSRIGYNFLGWFTALESGMEVTLETIVTNADDHILYALWVARDDILVTFDAGGGSTPNPESKLVTFDSAYSALATTNRSGYNFIGWYTEGGTTQVTPETIVAIADNHTLYARWQAVTNPPPPPAPGPGGDTPIPPAVMAPTPTPAVIIDNGPPAGPIFISDHVAYIIGYEDGTVRPERNVTRAEVATVFYRLLTEAMRKSNWSVDNSFPDVEQGIWYNIAVSVNSMMGVIRGYPDGSFRPDNSITRAELAAIAARFARAMAMRGDNEVSFNDISGHWAEADIRHAAIIGWVRGYPDGSFRPDQPITRAEFITLVNNVLGRIPESEEDLLSGDMAVWSDNADADAWYYIAIQEATNSHLYSYKDGKTVPGMQFEYESWTAMQQNWDWIQLEKDWIAKYSK